MIGIFDSGLGGLSVLAAVADTLPETDLCYLADTAHIPYGAKDDAFIRRRVLAIGMHLVEQGCTQIVVACNTATAASLSALRQAFPDIPVVGVEPGVKPAAASTRSGRIAVLATESTARSERLARLIRDHAATVQVDVVACPGWATRVETLRFDDAELRAEATHQLQALLADGVDQIVLGCTHYAFLAPILKPIVDGRASLVDVADAVARQCRRLSKPETTGDGTLILQATSRPEHLLAALPVLGLSHLLGRLTAPPASSRI